MTKPSISTHPGSCQGDDYWRAPGALVTVQGFRITGGMLYVGQGLKASVGGLTEPALVVPNAPVDEAHPDSGGSSMGYWPSYSDISPGSRAAYLGWLHGGRRAPDAYIGYVFLFYYGLERRLLVDRQHSARAVAEEPALVRELQELHSVYGARNSSFGWYCGSLLAYLDARKGTDSGHTPGAVVCGFTDARISLMQRMGAAAAAGRAIAPDDLLEYLGQNCVQLPTPARRCPAEFAQLFAARYTRTYPSGIVCRDTGARATVDYQPASAGVRAIPPVTLPIPLVSLPDATVADLTLMVRSCGEELAPYSRIVGRGEPPDTVSALSLLPSAILASKCQQSLPTLVSTLSDATGLRGLALTTAESLCSALGQPASALRGARSKVIHQLLGRLGYGLEPSPSTIPSAVLAPQQVVLFRLPHPADPPESGALVAGCAVLALACAVSLADGRIDAAEVAMIRTKITTLSGELGTDALRADAHMQWLLAERPGFKHALASLRKVPRAGLGDLCAYLIALAGADGSVSHAELAEVSRIAHALDLPSGDILSNVTGGAEPLPMPQGRVELDRKALQDRLAATENVAKVIEQVAKEAEADRATEHPVSETVSVLAGLIRGFLADAVAKDEWARSDLESLADQHGVLLDAAMDEVNEIACDRAEGQVFEGHDPITIDGPTAKELLG